MVTSSSMPWRFVYRRLLHSIAAIICFLILNIFLWKDAFAFGKSSEQQPELPRHQLWPEPEENNYTMDFPTTSEFQPVSIDPDGKTTRQLCDTFPQHMLSRVQPVLKMGFTESRDKIESQLDSVSACFSPEDLLIFSDAEEKLRGHRVIDVLAYLPDTYRNHPNFTKFDEYLELKRMRDNGTLKVGQDVSGKIDGWALDKFKFLPVVERAWAMKPNKEFYVFYETDTYILWDNMFRFLDFLDPETPLYIGSPSPGRIDGRRLQGTLFANGGPGYVLSRGAMKKLLHRRVGPTGTYIDPPFSERFRYLAHDDECCGDSILAFAAWELGIVMQGFFPLFTPYLTTSLRFDDAHWCRPLITMHKVKPSDMTRLWKWEFKHRTNGRPILYSDLWQFYRPGIDSSRVKWNNDAEFSFQPADEAKPNSFGECERLCLDDERCFQFQWKGRDRRTCHLMHAIHYGIPQEDHEEDGKWIDHQAGWLTERIETWRNKRTCEHAEWVNPSLIRRI